MIIKMSFKKPVWFYPYTGIYMNKTLLYIIAGASLGILGPVLVHFGNPAIMARSSQIGSISTKVPNAVTPWEIISSID